MPLFQAIAAMSENRVIGLNNKLPWHLPEDYRWFKHKTLGGTLIMGRKTFESIGKPLPGRKTIVVSRNAPASADIEICRDLETLLKTDIPNAWVCGGTEIYTAMLPACAYLYLTRVKQTLEGDAFFPEFESLFRLEGIVHENEKFSVECWRNPKSGAQLSNLLDPAPFT